MKTIYIDADACPVKDEVYKVASRYRWQVLVVANQYINTPASPRILSVVVDKGEDVADDYIAERAELGDIVVTADILLASRCLQRGARVVGPKGRTFTADNIGDSLSGRELSQQLREMGVATGGPKPMDKRARSQFLSKLDQLVNAVVREVGG